jgi:hypothetical protein
MHSWTYDRAGTRIGPEKRRRILEQPWNAAKSPRCLSRSGIWDINLSSPSTLLTPPKQDKLNQIINDKLWHIHLVPPAIIEVAQTSK